MIYVFHQVTFGEITNLLHLLTSKYSAIDNITAVLFQVMAWFQTGNEITWTNVEEVLQSHMSSWGHKS